MPFDCENGRCQKSICWMGHVLFAAGIYQILFAAVANFWPFFIFDRIGIERPNHPLLWQGVGVIAGVLGFSSSPRATHPALGHRAHRIREIRRHPADPRFGGFQRHAPGASLWILLLDDRVWSLRSR